jgi:hypothetical protein
MNVDARAFTTRALVAIGIAFTLDACASRQSLAIETASDAWTCPEKQVAATDLGENNYRVTGCGKQDVLYCDYVTEDEYTAKQHSTLVCRPTKQVIEQTERHNQIADACAERCFSGGRACSEGCENKMCRDACDAMTDGCMKGCMSSAERGR